MSLRYSCTCIVYIIYKNNVLFNITSILIKDIMAIIQCYKSHGFLRDVIQMLCIIFKSDILSLTSSPRRCFSLPPSSRRAVSGSSSWRSVGSLHDHTESGRCDWETLSGDIINHRYTGKRDIFTFWHFNMGIKCLSFLRSGHINLQAKSIDIT